MHAFIIRPFGIKNCIDFDRVEQELIRPALNSCDFSGGTTAEFIEQGNIRTDMFEQILIADLVVADLSIHNANVFYELGIRHAFRDKRTFLIKSDGDQVPFDLKTDRYFIYDAAKPGARAEDLARALQATWRSQAQDSPVFQLLPGLSPTSADKFFAVPTGFREELAQYSEAGNRGNVQLLSTEVDGFAWRVMGLRMIGEVQFELKDWFGARETWQAVKEYDDMDTQANTKLGTVFQRLNDLVRSDQALDRALQSPALSNSDRAEIYALIGRNAKTNWEKSWIEVNELGLRQQSALISPYLERSFESYRRGFIEDRNHFYSGLNALAMVSVILELAAEQQKVWEDHFDEDEDAAYKLRKFQGLRDELVAGVKLAIRSRRVTLERIHEIDIWVEISAADLTFLSSRKPSRVAQVYRAALADAQGFETDSARKQLQLYRSLGIFKSNTETALAVVGDSPCETAVTNRSPRVVLFTGHRIDAVGRKNPRFPADKEDQARRIIAEALQKEKVKAGNDLLGISGGACGGDILFHEICDELGIPSRMYLAIGKNDYIKESVVDGGADWVERFKRLFGGKQPLILSETGELPDWLLPKQNYGVWQRCNLWMLHNALEISEDKLILMALWNGILGDGPGGTQDMVLRAKGRGATFIHLDSRKLLS